MRKQINAVGLRKLAVGTALAAALLCMLSACGRQAGELRLEGIGLLEQGKYEEAIVKLDEAMDASDGKVGVEQYDILLYRAEAEYMTGDYDAAKHTYEILIQVDGEKEPYVSLLAQVNAKLKLKEASEALNSGELETARSLLDEVKAAGLVTDKDVEFNEAVYLEKTARWEEARAAFEAYCEKYPDDEAAGRELKFLRTRVPE